MISKQQMHDEAIQFVYEVMSDVMADRDQRLMAAQMILMDNLELPAIESIESGDGSVVVTTRKQSTIAYGD